MLAISIVSFVTWKVDPTMNAAKNDKAPTWKAGKRKAKHMPSLSLDEKMLARAKKNRERLEKLRLTDKPKEARSAHGTMRRTSSMDKSFIKKKR